MAEVRNSQKKESEISGDTVGKTRDGVVSDVQKPDNRAGINGPEAAGRSIQSSKATDSVSAKPPAGKEASQLEAARRLSSLGGASATEKLLGLDMRPTMPGALVSPPGNSDFLRHLSPTMRRKIMRNMLARQREKMRRLAGFLKDKRDNSENDEEATEQSFLQTINDTNTSDSNQLVRAIEELGRSARMLDVLDELLSMQDYTISQMGTFSKG